MAYLTKTISAIVDEIDAKKIYLPAIQRKYVGGEAQIVRLMDSIMRGYPFGTFLFWKVRKKVVNEKGYSLYEFIKDYHERDHYKNDPAGQPFSISELNEDETIYSALDGQQRLTSLYIALKGSFSVKLPKKHKSNNEAYPKKELYFNLLSEKKSEDDDIAYEFSFLTADDAKKNSENRIWFKVKDIVQFTSFTELNKFVRGSDWGDNEIAADNISKLFERIKVNEIIDFFEVQSDSIDDVLDIFVRVNSGGTVLSKTDLLFSTIVSYWDDGRDEIDDFLSVINKIGDHYSFGNDFLMRTCLYVMDLPISLKVESFGRDSVNKIKNAWEEIKSAVKDTINILNELGFGADNIIADNAILPLVYYRYKYGESAYKNDLEPKTKKVLFDVKMELRKYMVVSQIRHIFGQSTNSTLTSIRTELGKHAEKFQFAFLQGLTFSGDRSLIFDSEDIENWVDTFEIGAYTFMLLSLLYPDLKYGQKGFHQDHMHPRSSFDDDSELLALVLPNKEKVMDLERIERWRHQRNTLPNLQMLEASDNESKNDTPLIDWLAVSSNKENVKYLPADIDYSLSNFEEFMSKRKEIMMKKLESVLL